MCTEEAESSDGAESWYCHDVKLRAYRELRYCYHVNQPMCWAGETREVADTESLGTARM